MVPFVSAIAVSAMLRSIALDALLIVVPVHRCVV